MTSGVCMLAIPSASAEFLSSNRLICILSQNENVHRNRAALRIPGIGTAMATLRTRWAPKWRVAYLAAPEDSRVRNPVASA